MVIQSWCYPDPSQHSLSQLWVPWHNLFLNPLLRVLEFFSKDSGVGNLGLRIIQAVLLTEASFVAKLMEYGILFSLPSRPTLPLYEGMTRVQADPKQEYIGTESDAHYPS
jgi:hypothetical protein